MKRLEFLTRVERPVDDGMGGTIMLYNNLYASNITVLQRTDDGMYPVYEWTAIEIDPRTVDIDPVTNSPIAYTGLQKLYNQDSLATMGDNIGAPVGPIDNSMNLFAGIIGKMSLIVNVSPGDEIVM